MRAFSGCGEAITPGVATTHRIGRTFLSRYTMHNHHRAALCYCTPDPKGQLEQRCSSMMLQTTGWVAVLLPSASSHALTAPHGVCACVRRATGNRRDRHSTVMKPLFSRSETCAVPRAENDGADRRPRPGWGPGPCVAVRHHGPERVFQAHRAVVLPDPRQRAVRGTVRNATVAVQHPRCRMAMCWSWSWSWS